MPFPIRFARLALCVLPCLYGTANASLSWDYVDLARIVDGKTHTLVINDRVYLSGFTLDTAFSVHDHVHLRAISRSWDARTPGPGGGFVNGSNNDWHSIAVGGHLPFDLAGVPMQVWGDVSVDHYSMLNLTGTGYGVGAGLRAQVLDPLELGLWYRTARTDTPIGGSTLDLDPWLMGFDLLYSLSPNVALHLAMTRGSLSLEESGSSASFSNNTTELGLRYLFDSPRSRVTEAPLPLSYNQIQLGYLVSGDLKESGGDNWDLNEGFLISGMVSPIPNMFLAATFLGTNYDASGGGGPESINPLDQLSIGPGAYYTLVQGDLHYSGYAQITYNRMTLLDGITMQGEGFRIGARAAWGHLIDAHLYYGDAHARARLGSSAFRVKPRVTGIELGSSPFANGFGVTLGYEDTRHDTNLGGPGSKVDTTHWRLGVRQQF
ncbi:hypothetical protein [Isoalcanivorax indicus]|uniref:hypothetical protein n=1 Tax=Isoalcanivorax indicus TaxID=2202653 RepID=UPI000DB98A31|nr:hypothetical protein [Isoalcanivorax indicus]